MTENEKEDIKEEELITKIKDELLSLSEKFILMTNYLEQLKVEIENDDLKEKNDNNKNIEKNYLLNKKRINSSHTTISTLNNSKNEINQKHQKVDSMSYSSKNNSYSKIRTIKNKNIKKLNDKTLENKEKERLINTKIYKRKKIDMDYSRLKIQEYEDKIENYEENEEEEEEDDDDEEEYINSDEESSDSSMDEKKLNKNKNHTKHRKKKIKQNQNGIISKLYPVRTIQNEVISSGYRVYCKCKGVSMCFGPYADFNFAYDFRKLMLSQLKMFTGDIPDVLEKIKEFLKRTKEAVDKKQAPVQMFKKYKKNKQLKFKKIN